MASLAPLLSNLHGVNYSDSRRRANGFYGRDATVLRRDHGPVDPTAVPKKMRYQTGEKAAARKRQRWWRNHRSGWGPTIP